MTQIYTGILNDDFNRHDGAMVGYYAADQSTAVVPRHHYDLRAFHVTDQTLTFTQTDYDFWHGYAYNTQTVGSTRSLGALAGTETWDTSSGAVTVGKDAAYRYSNSLRLTVVDSSLTDSSYGVSTYGASGYGAATLLAPSFYSDDILTDFNDPLRSYYIEIVLRSFPAQSATPHFDLSNSFIDISTNANFNSQETRSIPFSSSLNDVSAGGDTFLRFNRTALSGIDLTQIKAIRFRMRAIGGTITLIVQAIRVIDDLYTYQAIDVDTKRQQLARSIPRAGGTEPGSVFGDVYFQLEKPKNASYVTMFNSGHNPTGNDNVFRQFFRTKTNGDRLEIKLAARDTQSRLSIIEHVSGVDTPIFQTSTLTNILTNETFYYLVTEVSGTQVRASIYQRSGVSLGALVYTTGFQTTAISGAGRVGYSFEPYNYDFTLQFLAPQSTEFAIFQSTVFQSRKLVRGVTLYPVNSKPINVLDSLTPKAWGDATLSTSAEGIITVTRLGTLTQGGMRYEPASYIGNSTQLVLTGELFTSSIQGTYRVALIDQFDEAQWLSTIPVVLTNQWNVFSLPISPGLVPETVYIHIQQLGSYAGSYRLRNVRLGYKTIAWNVSGDNGITWQPFLDSLGQQYTGAMFATPATQVKVQAVANTDQGWIGGYQLEPHYVY